MKRTERNEFNSIRRTMRDFEKQGCLGCGTTLTIRTDGSAEYKAELDKLYTSLGFHPASVRIDPRMYDDKERIIYIYGLTWELDGEEHPWTELFTAGEKERFRRALG